MAMDLNIAFSVLGIEPTKDENLIRSSYHAALPANNPEENPDGFKRLRGAYESAVDYSRISEMENASGPAASKEYSEIKNAMQRIYAIRTSGSSEKLQKAADRIEKEFIELCENSVDELRADDMRLLVYAYSNQKKPDKAIAAITSKCSYEKEIKGYHMLLSHLYKQKKDYEMAIKHGRLRLEGIKGKLNLFEACGKLCGDDTKESLMQSLSDANLQIGLMLMACAKEDALEDERIALYSEAASFLDSAWNAAPDNLAARINLAYCYFNLREDKKARAIYDELIGKLGAQNALMYLKQMIDNRKDMRK